MLLKKLMSCRLPGAARLNAYREAGNRGQNHEAVLNLNGSQILMSFGDDQLGLHDVGSQILYLEE
jgi:hypothetical protein